MEVGLLRDADREWLSAWEAGEKGPMISFNPTSHA